MARRWQLPLWVLIGLVLFVAALWENAAESGIVDRSGDRTEAVGDSDQRAVNDSVPGELAFVEGEDGQIDDGGTRNVLRPTTTTTRPPTTTSTSHPDSDAADDDATVTGDDVTGADDDDDRAGGDGTGEPDPNSASTVPDGGEGTATDGDPRTSTTVRSNGSGNGGGPGPDSISASTPPTSAGDSDEPKMTTVYQQTFAGGTVTGGGWEIYDSVGHAGWGLRRPSAVSVVPASGAVGDRVLRITAKMGTGDEAGKLVSGGIKLLGQSMTYGRYSFRARVDADRSEVTSGVVLLWPADNDWPAGGEINIMETWANRSTRAPVESNLHWADNGEDRFTGVTHSAGGRPISASDWHVYTLDWTRSGVSVSIDGGKPVVLSTDPARIPHRPMDLTIQLDGFDSPDAPGEQPTLDGEVRLEVDWIRIERPVEG